MTDLLFLDIETTGLDPDVHDAWEVAYAYEDGPVFSVVVPHTLKTADPKALALNGYHDRFPGGARASGALVDVELRTIFEGKTIVGANPAFDTGFLRRRWGASPWHYRMVDVETYAMPILGLDRPQSLKNTTEAVRERGFEIPEPDHTAAGDVATLRAVYKALRSLAAKG